MLEQQLRSGRSIRDEDRHGSVTRQENSMERTIIGRFATRREAELAVEHLVQDRGIARTAVAVQAAGAANSAGLQAAGADVESGHPGVDRSGNPELEGEIEVSVDCDAAQASDIEGILKEAARGAPVRDDLLGWRERPAACQPTWWPEPNLPVSRSSSSGQADLGFAIRPNERQHPGRPFAIGEILIAVQRMSACNAEKLGENGMAGDGRGRLRQALRRSAS
ncbi:hypothetical protein ACRAVF_30005 [Bradyrhizobium oligotrophicum S58]